MLVVCDHFPSYGSKSIQFLVDALEKRGHIVWIASSDIGINGEKLHIHDGKYKVLRYPSIKLFHMPYTYTICASHHLKHICAEFKPDVIHTQFMTYWMSLSSAILAKYGCPLVTTLHGFTLPNETSSPLARLALKTIYRTLAAHLIRKSNAVICVSKEVKAKLGVIYRNLRIPVEVIPIGLGRNESNLQVTIQREDMKQRLGMNDKRVFVFLGRVVRDKGVYELASAFRIIRSQNENVALLVIGDGQSLTAMKKLLKDVPDVHFAGFKAKVGNYLNASDIMVLPSYHEGLPTSVLEGMFFALPFIATNVGGIQDLFEMGANGVIVPVKSISELASAMQLMATTTNTMLATGGKQNKALVSERFMQDTIIEQIIGLYERVISSSEQTG